MKELKNFLKSIGGYVAGTITVLTLITLMFSTILDGNSFLKKLFPPAPLEGSWKGNIEGDSIVFCFKQNGNVIWGEFQWKRKGALVSADGIVDVNTLILDYERLSIGYPDKGIYKLNYEKKDGIEYLVGYWKSTHNPVNRDAITFIKIDTPCDLEKFPFPGGLKDHN